MKLTKVNSKEIAIINGKSILYDNELSSRNKTNINTFDCLVEEKLKIIKQNLRYRKKQDFEKKFNSKKTYKLINSLKKQNLPVKLDNSNFIINDNKSFLNEYIKDMYILTNEDIPKIDSNKEEKLKEFEEYIKKYINILIDYEFLNSDYKEKELKELLSTKKREIYNCNKNKENDLENLEFNDYIYNLIYNYLLKIYQKFYLNKNKFNYKDLDKSKKNDMYNKKIKKSQIEKEIIGKARGYIANKIISIGKAQYHFYDLEQKEELFSSFGYELINAIDKLHLTLITTNTYSILTLYQIIKDISSDEIINKEIFKWWKKNDSNYINKIYDKLIKYYVYNNCNINKKEFCQKTFDSLEYFRNSVFHYRKIAQEKFLKDIEIIGEPLLNNEINNISISIKQKYISNEVNKYYNKDYLEKMFSDIYSDGIIPKSYPYLPSFSNILKDLIVIRPELNNKIHLRFLYKEIYYHDFFDLKMNLNQIEVNLKENKLIKINKSVLENFLKVFGDLKEQKISIYELAAKIQSEKIRQLGNKSKIINEKTDKKADYLNIILSQIIANELENHVIKKYKYLIENEKIQEVDVDMNKLIEENNFIKSEENKKINKEVFAFYLMIKLISPKQLNLLKGNLLKFRQYYEKILKRATFAKDKQYSEILCDFIGNRKQINKINNIEAEVEFKFCFVENLEEFIYLCDICLYNEGLVIDNYKKEEDKLKNKFKELEVITNGKKNEIKRRLYGFNKYNYIIDEIKILEYQKFIEENREVIESNNIDTVEKFNIKNKYNQLKNHIEYVDNLKIHSIISDIYSYLISYCFYIERDIMYYILGIITLCDKSENLNNHIKNMIYEFDKPKLISESFGKFGLKNDLIFKKIMFNYEDYIGKIRNKIDHFDLFQDEINEEKNILELSNLMYINLKYNIKMKNQFLPKVDKVFRIHGVIPTIKMVNEPLKKFEIEKLDSIKYTKKICDEKILYKISSEEYLNHLKKSLEL